MNKRERDTVRRDGVDYLLLLHCYLWYVTQCQTIASMWLQDLGMLLRPSRGRRQSAIIKLPKGNAGGVVDSAPAWIAGSLRLSYHSNCSSNSNSNSGPKLGLLQLSRKLCQRDVTGGWDESTTAPRAAFVVTILQGESSVP